MKFKIGDWLSQKDRNGYFYIFQIINIREYKYLIKFLDGSQGYFPRQEIEDAYMDFFYPSEYLTDEEKAELL